MIYNKCGIPDKTVKDSLVAGSELFVKNNI